MYQGNHKIKCVNSLPYTFYRQYIWIGKCIEAVLRFLKRFSLLLGYFFYGNRTYT
jgi:hypothetical protein